MIKDNGELWQVTEMMGSQVHAKPLERSDPRNRKFQREGLESIEHEYLVYSVDGVSPSMRAWRGQSLGGRWRCLQ